MRNKLGSISMLLGIVLIAAAVSLFLRNDRENTEAEEQSEAVLKEMMEVIEVAQEIETNINTDTEVTEVIGAEEIEDEQVAYLNPYDPAMKELLIDGYAYIGYITIPEAGLQLPIMSDWDYTKLKIAPCRFYGSVKTDDLVIAGHNYRSHFSKIKNLQPGAIVYFTDMTGMVHKYEAVNIEVLTPDAVEEMNAGVFDLTLFTCTYGGQSRFALRCDRVME